MRKLALFLVVFGLGFAALLLIDRASRGASEPEAADQAPEVAVESDPESGPADPPGGLAGAPELGGGGQPDQDTGVRPRPDMGAGQEGVRVRLEGPLSFTAFGASGARSHRFNAGHVQPREPDGRGVYDAHNLTIETYDPATGDLRMTVTAVRGRIRIDEGGGMRLADEGGVELFDVTVTQHTGGALVPLVFSAEHLIGRIDVEAFETAGDTEVVIEGVGLSGRGRGLVFDGLSGSFRLTRGGSFDFSSDTGTPLRFSTPENGPLQIDRVDDTHLTLRASDGVEIGLQADPLGRVTAREAELFARIEGSEVQLERAIVTGEVEATRGTDRFAGDRARLAFGEDNQLAQLEMEGSPEWELTLADQGEGALRVEGDGVGPLIVDWLGTLHFDMRGVSSFRVPSRDLVVQAAGGMSGTINENGSDGQFRALESVRLTDALWNVVTDELSIRIWGDGRVRTSAVGLTRIAGTDASGQPVDMTATDGVELAGEGEAWRVVLAREVELVTTGVDGLRMTAGLVRDADLAQQTLEAEGGVTYSSPLGTGQAQRASVLGSNDFELHGGEGDLARFRITPPVKTHSAADEAANIGNFQAREIAVHAQKVDATGDVSATILAGARTYRLESDTLQVETENLERRTGSTFTAVGTGVRRASLRESGLDVTLSADEVRLSGAWVESEVESGNAPEPADVVASGSVEVEYFGGIEVGAAGARFILERDASGRIEAEEGQRVSAWGRFPDSELPYELTADWVEFNAERVRAPKPSVFVDTQLMPFGLPVVTRNRFTRADADWLVADQDGLLLTGGVHLEGADQEDYGLTLDADMLRLLVNNSDSPVARGEAAPVVSVERFEAWGGFRANYQGNALVQGNYCLASPERLLLEGGPARVDVLGLALESRQIDVDLVNFLVTSERGIMRSSEDHGDWSIEFSSVRPIQDGDETMIALLAPVYTARTSGARADWAVFWIDSEAWGQKGREVLWGEPNSMPEGPVPVPLPERDLLPNIFRQLHAGSLSGFMRALYLEGEAEVTENGAREARADAIFIDTVANQAWLRNAEVVPVLHLGTRVQRVRTRAEELHTAVDGTLRASHASLSACDHEVPHYQIETGELVLEPREGGSWRISARKNRLFFGGGFQVPLPPIGRAVLDPGGDLVGFENDSGELITFDRLVFGNTARFGTAVTTAFQRDIGKVGKTVSKAAGFSKNVKGKWNYEVAWLSSRGPLARVGLQLRERSRRGHGDEEFWLDMYVSAVPDGGSDRGLVRVDEADRDDLRQWANARGRYPIANNEWLDLAFTKQSDAGVQAEFYENEFLEYEERDNYLHWRKADGVTYLDAAASVRSEGFRTQVEELPSVGLYQGSTPVADIAGVPVFWGTKLDVEYLRRRESDRSEPEVFGDGVESIFDDGLGDSEVLRVDNTHRLAMPIELGDTGVRATPFVDAELTAWDRGEDSSDHPARAGLFGGAELSASFWKVRDDGFIHALAPSASFRGDLAIEESGGQPVVFSERERPLDGKELRLGLRSRWWQPGNSKRFDLELLGIQRYDRADSLPDQRELGLLGNLHTDIGVTPFVLLYDLRFDLEESTTSYSRTTIGARPRKDLALELSHDRGLDDAGQQLYEAATVAARYRFSPKWEVEGRQTISFLDNGRLNNDFSLRRFAHDVLLEIRVSFRAGEGTSFSFNLAPLLAWRRRRLGRLGF
ncbi:MAG: hypothetical protein ACI8QZ_001435 [Chlamydiales bacterium]|jgi:hypothetical protein